MNDQASFRCGCECLALAIALRIASSTVSRSLPKILGQEPQNGVAVLLQEPILSPVPAVRFGVAQVKGAVDFDRNPQFFAQQIDFHLSDAVEWDGQFGIHLKPPASFGQCL